MRDPYEVLGVPRDVSADDLKSAYRKLAKKYHPDLHPGDPDIESRFKEVSAAYDFLSDETRRQRYDRGEIGADGNEKPRWSGFGRTGGFPGGGYRSHPGAGAGAGARTSAGARSAGMHGSRRTGTGTGAGGAGGKSGFGFRSGLGAEDLFSELFGNEDVRGGSAHVKGGDYRLALDVDFEEAAKGGRKRLTLPDGRSLNLSLPPGAEHGQVLRLRGQGQAGLGGAQAGDALIELRIKPHTYFTRKGDDIHVDVPISLKEAVQGASINVPTIHGKVALKIPSGSNNGTMLRLKGKGIARKDKGSGDQYITLRIALPEDSDEELRRFVKNWKGADYSPRKKMGME